MSAFERAQAACPCTTWPEDRLARRYWNAAIDAVLAVAPAASTGMDFHGLRVAPVAPDDVDGRRTLAGVPRGTPEG